MKIETIEPVKPSMDWRIIIKEFSKDKLESLIQLLNGLGFRRDEEAEVRNKKFSGELDSFIFVNGGDFFQFVYVPDKNLLAGGWKSKNYDGPAFSKLLESKLEEEK